MGGASSLFGDDDQAKELEKQQKKAAAEAMKKKVLGIQDTIGSRTTDLIRRYGIGGNSGGASPLA